MYRSLALSIAAGGRYCRLHSSAIEVLKSSGKDILAKLSQHSQLDKHLVKNGAAEPFSLVKSELKDLASSIVSQLGANNKLLSAVASHYFQQQGKQMRPGLVLLMSRAVSPTETVLPQQIRLAEITEMIHTASLVHDDVIDNADTRRGQPSANSLYGTKQAVLAGDFLLARASVMLARLRNVDVIELLSTVIADLVEGEFMQMDSRREALLSFDDYLRKTYLKTAALVAKSVRAAALLGGQSDAVADIAYAYGKHLGIAFQVVDDMLDFTETSATLGKPADTDLSLGLATAPVLYAQQEHPELTALIVRRFQDPGDVKRARDIVMQSSGLRKARTLAEEQCALAVTAIMQLPASAARDALVTVSERVLSRRK